MTVKISVITATWNCVSTVEGCLAAVQSQSHNNREHIVIDGGSKDGTVDVLRRHANQLAAWVSEPDRGIYDALNKGVDRAAGDVVGFLHADDVFAAADVLAGVARCFEDPMVSAVYGDLDYVSKDDLGKVIRHWRSKPYNDQDLKRGWMPAHPTLYVRREWYQRIGGFDTRYRIAADYDSILRLFSQPGFRAVYLPRVMVKMRVGGASNRSLRNIMRKSREDLLALQRSGVGGWGALAAKNFSKLGQFLPRTAAR